jgi:hypothetical protein
MALTFDAVASSLLGVDRSAQGQQSLDIEAKKLAINEKIIDQEAAQLETKKTIIITLVIIFVIALSLFLFFYLKK